MTSSTRRWNGSTGTTTAACTASSATSHPPSSKPPTTLNQRHSNRSRHQHEAGNEPETVQLHPHRIVLDQPGRTPVRNPHRPTHPARGPPERGGPGERRPRVDQQLEPGPETVHLDQDRRGHPPVLIKIYREDLWRRTLVIGHSRGASPGGVGVAAAWP